MHNIGIWKNCCCSSLHRLLVLQNVPEVWGIYRCDEVGDMLLMFLLRTDMLRPIRSWWFYSLGRSEVPLKLKKQRKAVNQTSVYVLLRAVPCVDSSTHFCTSHKHCWDEEDQCHHDSKCCNYQGEKGEFLKVVLAVFGGVARCDRETKLNQGKDFVCNCRLKWQGWIFPPLTMITVPSLFSFIRLVDLKYIQLQ